MQLWLDLMPSPVGELSLVGDEQGALRALEFDSNDERLHRLLARHYRAYSLSRGRAPALVREALEAYFAGDPSHLDALPVATGGTEFQRLVWQALRGIPFGTTISYGELAARIGRPGASRAVGLANGANPISIVVPCHRVIGANGTLTGYGGGLSRKRWLVEHEHERGLVQGELALS
jgi:methylated-DNA-[protein]-cysteine S-methyltransferase